MGSVAGFSNTSSSGPIIQYHGPSGCAGPIKLQEWRVEIEQTRQGIRDRGGEPLGPISVQESHWWRCRHVKSNDG